MFSVRSAVEISSAEIQEDDLIPNRREQMIYSHPTAASAALIQTADELHNHIRDIQEAAVCGIDCEWPPDRTAGTPAACLVQLALWSAAYGLRIVLLDMLQLPPAEARSVLQTLFRNKQILKVGYSLGSDVRAIAAALGEDGANAAAVVTPAVDIGILHSCLLHQGAPGVNRARGSGLSGIVEAQLGAPLNKEQQCSAWGHRPLTPQQRSYAANDACCLLALLDSLVRCVGHPGKWPMPQLAVDGDGDDQSCGLLASEMGSELAGTRDEASGKSAASVDAAAALPTAPASGRPVLVWTPTQLKEAAAAWGGRLEMSHRRPCWRDTSGRLHAKFWNPPARATSGAKAILAKECAFPAHVPWMDSQRRLVSPPRFIADVMAHGLARQLRLWGVDAEAVGAVGKEQRHAVHRQLVETAEREGRVILTRDAAFMRRHLSDQAYLVRAETKQEQLREVVAAFGLPVGDALLSRCARCNGRFLERPVPPEELPAGHGVPAGVLERRHDFWVCERCDGVYWQGSMYDRAMERLTSALATMSTSEPSVATREGEGGKRPGQRAAVGVSG